jgi:soluble lytic murein transglycosylase-like protein
MNIHTSYWQGLGYSREQLKDATTTIEAGARILKGIISIVERPSVDKVATLYNYLGATEVSQYGARVRSIYLQKPWLER